MVESKKALITGITGFVGSHMAELLVKEGYEVVGIARWRARREHLAELNGKIRIEEADLLDSHSLNNIMLSVRPDYVFHLAAQSFVKASWTSPAATAETNIIGSINLFEAIRNSQIQPRIQIACSSEEYGMVYENEVPIKEDNPLRPLSPYASSKVAMDFYGYQYFQSYGMDIIRTRGFNHTGPRRGEVFAESTFAQQIAKIEKGLQEPIVEVGNLESYRDYTDVRDMVKGYLLAALKCKAGEAYNICSGQAVKMENVLNTLLGFSSINIEVRQDPSRMRPSDVPVLLGDNSKFRAATDWRPEIPFEQTMEDLLNYWRERV